MKLSGKLECPLTGVVFVFCATHEELVKQVNKLEPNGVQIVEGYAGRAMRATKDSTCFVFIWATKASTLAHECIHATDFAFDWIGQPPLGEGHELHAYYMDMIFRNYCTVLNKDWDNE